MAKRGTKQLHAGDLVPYFLRCPQQNDSFCWCTPFSWGTKTSFSNDLVPLFHSKNGYYSPNEGTKQIVHPNLVPLLVKIAPIFRRKTTNLFKIWVINSQLNPFYYPFARPLPHSAPFSTPTPFSTPPSNARPVLRRSRLSPFFTLHYSLFTHPQRPNRPPYNY